MKICLISGITLLFATIPASFAASVINLDSSFFPKKSEGLEPLSDGTFNPTKFWISTFKSNAANAEFYCNLAGHRLLSVRTERKERELENIMEIEGKKVVAWTSGQDIENEGRWVWGNGDKVLFNRFPSYEVDKANADCLTIYLFKQQDEYVWGKTDCSYENYFICERKDL